jgi:CDP-4-dehydro-6-deoxyglucose reductase, E1
MIDPEATPETLRARIGELVSEFCAANWPDRPFVPGTSPVPITGKVFDDREVRLLVEASLDFWLTTGRFAADFERRFAAWMDRPHAMLVNSGSSANLLAMTALTSPQLGARRLVPGDEVITCAAGFPTTVAPILQNQLVPVFLDVQIPTYNLDPARLEEAVGPRTRAIFLAHTLGNPFDLDRIMEVAERHGLWVIEDCCDAVGATFRGRKVGTFGHLATVSFYPAHHLTMGEGGAVLTGDPQLKRIVESFRDWGRDCWCGPGHDNSCHRRFDWQLGQLPRGYDHKFTFRHIGYNLKATDMQAAVGLAQLDKLPGFLEKRAANFAYLMEGLQGLRPYLELPEVLPQAGPSWFGLPLTLAPDTPLDRQSLLKFLDSRKIGTRLLFGGNILRQPAFTDIPHRVVGTLEGADRVMERTFWIGVYPGLTRPMLDFVLQSLSEAFQGQAR